MIRAAIFDRDGVLTTLDEARLAREVLATLPLPRDDLARRWVAFTRGRVLRAEDEMAELRAFLLATGEELGLGADALGAFGGLDYADYVVAYPDAADALDAARAAGLRVGLLTNNSAGLSPLRMLAAVGLDARIDVAMSAQLVGAAKPAPEAYLGAASALGVAPEACLYFDDTPGHVAGARAVGMQAFLVDRTRATHAPDDGVIRDLTALAAILFAGA